MAATSARHLERGTDIGGYVVECKLGEGGMSVVYGAVQPRIGKRVAIKVLSRTFDDPAGVERFEQEARVVNAIGHKNIVDVFQFGELPDGRSFFVMEWLEGETLGARLKRGPLQVRETIGIIEEVCDALEAAHELKVVHRDLKADNVFLVTTRKERAVKLLDFGLAKLTQPDAAATNQKTGVGILVGTPSYMSPEQARAREVDSRTDIYALGCLMFYMLTGKLPFRADNPLDLLNMHLTEPPPGAADTAAVPRALSDLVKQMMAKAPEQRPSIAQIRQTLLKVRSEKSTKSSGSRRGLWIVIGACALASGVLIVAAVAMVVNRKPAAAQIVAAGRDAPAIATITPDAAVTVMPPAAPVIDVAPQILRKDPVKPKPPATQKTGSGSNETKEPAPPTPPSEDVMFPGALVLTVDVASEITIDGVVKATNSLGGKFEMKPGKHMLRITAPQRQTVEREVVIETAATTSMTVSAGAAPSTAAAVDAGVEPPR